MRFNYSSYYENIKQYVIFIIKNSDIVSWKWAHVKSEKETTLGPGCQLGALLSAGPVWFFCDLFDFFNSFFFLLQHFLKFWNVALAWSTKDNNLKEFYNYYLN